MDVCESTTPARLKRNLPKLVLPHRKPDEQTYGLYIETGDGFMRAPDTLVIERAQQLVAAGFCPSATVVTNPSQVIEFLTLQLGARNNEVFAVMLLDKRRRFIGYEELFEGTIDTTTVEVRRVLSCVVQSRASSVILAHNHPQGACVPSRADAAITDKLQRMLTMLDVELLDHIIIGETAFSFEARGVLKTPWLAAHADS